MWKKYIYMHTYYDCDISLHFIKFDKKSILFFSFFLLFFTPNSRFSKKTTIFVSIFIGYKMQSKHHKQLIIFIHVSTISKIR